MTKRLEALAKQVPRRFKGVTLTCTKCGHRGRREWMRARCPACGVKATYCNVT